MIKVLRFSFLALLTTVASLAHAQETTFSWSHVTATQTNLSTANVYTQAPITLTFEKGEAQNWPAENKEKSIRMYAGTTLTIAAQAGYVVSKVAFTPTGASYSAANLAYNGTAITDDWSLPTPVQEVKLVASATARFKQIAVTYAANDPTTVAAPTIEGTELFLGTTSATLSAAAGTTIYYTLDGSDPTTLSKVYSAPIALNATTTVKAIAANGSKTSGVAAKTFTAAGEAPTIDAFKAMAQGTAAKLTLTDARVIYADATNRNVYVQDASGAICFYNAGLSLATGDVLNGSVVGTLTHYKNLPELTANGLTTAATVAKTTGAAIAPIATTVAAVQDKAYLCNLVQLSGVRLDSVGKDLYAYAGGDSIQVYDQIGIAKGTKVVKGSENNTVTGILVIYDTKYEIYPTTLDGMTTTSIVRTEATAKGSPDAPVYSLSGQRVDAAYKGIVIRSGKKYLQR